MRRGPPSNHIFPSVQTGGQQRGSREGRKRGGLLRKNWSEQGVEPWSLCVCVFHRASWSLQTCRPVSDLAWYGPGLYGSVCEFQSAQWDFSHPILGEDAVHPLGVGLLLHGHALLLQLPDTASLKFVPVHPDRQTASLRTDRPIP